MEVIRWSGNHIKKHQRRRIQKCGVYKNQLVLEFQAFDQLVFKDCGAGPGERDLVIFDNPKMLGGRLLRVETIARSVSVEWLVVHTTRGSLAARFWANEGVPVHVFVGTELWDT